MKPSTRFEHDIFFEKFIFASIAEMFHWESKFVQEMSVRELRKVSIAQISSTNNEMSNPDFLTLILDGDSTRNNNTEMPSQVHWTK